MAVATSVQDVGTQTDNAVFVDTTSLKEPINC